MSNTHLTAVTRYVDFEGDRFAHRRWGNTTTSQPALLLVQHFRGGMDHSDPLMTDGLAQDRKVIHLQWPRHHMPRRESREYFETGHWLRDDVGTWMTAEGPKPGVQCGKATASYRCTAAYRR